MLTSQETAFTLDNQGRFLCNTLEEAINSAAETVGGRKRDFDVIVIGGGTFGAAVAQRLFQNDPTHSRRILVLEAGPFVLPEHVQNTNYLGGVPDMRAPWLSHSALDYKGLLFAIGGRSLSWGGWSPELFEDETKTWPAEVMQDLRAATPPNSDHGYFWQASDLIGVTETNDFIYGPLHIALRKQLREGLNDAANAGITGLTFAQLPEHPAIRYHDPATQGPINAGVLRDWLGLLPGDTTPEPELRELFKLEAPLAVQSQAEPGQYPGNKFSTVPILTRSARLASNQADGVGTQADARKRLMVVPKVNVLDLATETLPDNSVRVTGVRVWDNGTEKTVWLAPPRDGRESVAIIALGTIESTRLAKLTFQQSLSWRAASRMGENLVAHLRSNFNIRVPVASLKQLPPMLTKALQVSALLVKGRALVAGQQRYFHFQITASGLNKLGDDSEAELFKKIPTLEHLQEMLRADDTHVVITLRGIGEMCPHNPDSRVDLSQTDAEFGRAKAQVSVGNAKAKPEVFPGSPQTTIDRQVWNAMDALSDKLALIFAAGQPFDIITKNQVIPVPANASAATLAQLLPHAKRRDDLGTTHHDAGTLRMSKDAKDGVTDIFGCIHDTKNCYVTSPAVFPTVGSPNPMLTGVALARRTADRLERDVLTKAPIIAAGNGWRPLFDGTQQSAKQWRKVGPDGTGFAHVNGELVSYGNSGLVLFYYAKESFADFTLKLQFRIFDRGNHNSGVFVRFPAARLDLSPVMAARAAAEGIDVVANPAFKAVVAGFEIQIDDNARGDQTKDFYGIRPEPDGLWKNRTGAIYKIPAGDRIWHENRNEDAWQQYDASGPQLIEGVWFEYEIDVRGNVFKVNLRNTQSGESKQVTRYQNGDGARGQSPGYIGIQAYPGSVVAYRHIQIHD
jgi:hypothetical protein